MSPVYLYGAVNGDGKRALIAISQAKTKNEVHAILVDRYQTVEIVSFKSGIYTISDLYAGRSGIRNTYVNRERYGIPE